MFSGLVFLRLLKTQKCHGYLHGMLEDLLYYYVLDFIPNIYVIDINE